MTCRPTCIQPSPSNAHCGACHHTFSGISAFDRHRRSGECLSPLAIGLRADRKGIWRFPAPDDTKRSAWPQREPDEVDPCLEPAPSAATIASVMAIVDAPYRPGLDVQFEGDDL